MQWGAITERILMFAGNHIHFFGELLKFLNAHLVKVHHVSATLNNPYRKESEFVNHPILFQGIWSA